MTAEKIDVLTVMQEAAYGLALADERSYGAGDDLLKARAAVAELIEAGNQWQEIEFGRRTLGRNAVRIRAAIEQRFLNALARVGAP